MRIKLIEQCPKRIMAGAVAVIIIIFALGIDQRAALAEKKEQPDAQGAFDANQGPCPTSEYIFEVLTNDPVIVGKSLIFQEPGSKTWGYLPFSIPAELTPKQEMDETRLLHSFYESSKVKSLSWLAFLSAEITENEGAEVIGTRVLRVTPIAGYENPKVKAAADAARKAYPENIGRRWAFVNGVTYCTVTSRIYSNKKKDWKGDYILNANSKKFYNRTNFTLTPITVASAVVFGEDGRSNFDPPLPLKSTTPLIITNVVPGEENPE